MAGVLGASGGSLWGSVEGVLGVSGGGPGAVLGGDKTAGSVKGLWDGMPGQKVQFLQIGWN